MNALTLFNMTAPLCACGELMSHPDEIKAGSCFCCQADVALGEFDAKEVRAGLAEMFNARSRHHHTRHGLRTIVAHV